MFLQFRRRSANARLQLEDGKFKEDTLEDLEKMMIEADPTIEQILHQRHQKRKFSFEPSEVEAFHMKHHAAQIDLHFKAIADNSVSRRNSAKQLPDPSDLQQLQRSSQDDGIVSSGSGTSNTPPRMMSLSSNSTSSSAVPSPRNKDDRNNMMSLSMDDVTEGLHTPPKESFKKHGRQRSSSLKIRRSGLLLPPISAVFSPQQQQQQQQNQDMEDHDFTSTKTRERSSSGLIIKSYYDDHIIITTSNINAKSSTKSSSHQILEKLKMRTSK